MKYNWKNVDKLIKITDSTPKQLLDWVIYVIKNYGIDGKKGWNYYPCIKSPYLGVWLFVTGHKFIVSPSDPDGQSLLYVPTLIYDDDGSSLTITCTWNLLNENNAKTANVLRAFKKHYKGVL